MKLKKKHVDSRVKKIIAASNYTIYVDSQNRLNRTSKLLMKIDLNAPRKESYKE
jgi:hypothetical protein